MSGLSTDQEAAVAQLRELTNGGDDDVAMSVLRSVDWDVQKAADLIFGNPSATHNDVRPRATFDIDDTQQGHAFEPVPQNNSITRPFFSLLALPFQVFSNIFRFIFGVLRIPFLSFRFTGLNFHRPRRPRANSRGPDRWLRELEEETGAVSIGRLNQPRGVSSSIGSSAAGPSYLTSRPNGTNSIFEEGRRLLPDFTLASYEEVLRQCQRDAKIGCIILVSEEHDDVPEFKRTTLTDTNFVKFLYDNDIVVWGGDVRDQDPWGAAEKLQATTYPFVAFVALQPRRVVGSSLTRDSAPPSLTVLSRHQGSSSSPDGPTSARTLLHHLETQVIPRVSSYLERLRAAQRQRERDRQLREEQDRAFQDTARRDKERIEAKIAAEKAQEEERKRLEAERLIEEARKEREAEIRRQKAAERMDWRRWTRSFISGKLNNGSKTLRIVVRLPSGERRVQQFANDDTLTTLYAFIDSQLIPSHLDVSSDPETPPNGASSEEAVLDSHVSTFTNPLEYWAFTVASSYPRQEIPWKRGVQLDTVSVLKGGGQVVVEMVAPITGPLSTSDDDDDDGYKTEED